ncbi:MAG TPA: Hsp70 family protein [Rhizomicrobium sp.]
MTACGLDFGTSNSAIGISRGGTVALAPVEGDATLIPSAVFYDYEHRGRIQFGSAAIDAYIGQTEGRLMRALKTILGSPLIDEKTILAGKAVALTEVIETFVRHLKTQAEHFAGQEISSVVHGRPVRFVDGDDAADAKAQDTLERIARKVGFREISFVYEPIAAAYHYEETATREELVLVADIGGGTSDFSVIRIGPNRRTLPDRAADILANGGARIGGTDFDARLNLAAVMPLLGLGTHLIEKNLPMPTGVYFDLATWATINFTYTFKMERDIRELLAQSQEPEKIARLQKTIHQRLGHRIAFAIEDAKIALSIAEQTKLPLAFIEPGLHGEPTRADFENVIREKTTRLHTIARECIADAGVRPEAIQTIFFTGGSARVPAVRHAIASAAPAATATEGADFLSVAMGLTQEAARRYGAS